jgi:hypothetical protein
LLPMITASNNKSPLRDAKARLKEPLRIHEFPS